MPPRGSAGRYDTAASLPANQYPDALGVCGAGWLYVMEELVAELGAAFLCADLSITPDVREDHASYIGNWLDVLKNDKRAIFSAASHASRAVQHLHELQPPSAG
jgi:antirestriction protein ArdC